MRRARPTKTSPPTSASSSARAPDVDQEALIFDLSFATETRYRPFELVAPGFVAAATDRAAPGMTRSQDPPPAPFVAVELTVSAEEGATDVAVAGLSSARGEHVLAVYDPARDRVTIEVRVEGRRHVLRRRTLRLPRPCRLAFVLCEQQVTVLVADPDTDPLDGASQWRPVLSERAKVAALLDLRRPEVLGGFAATWGTRPATSRGAPDGRVVVEDVRSGPFGMTGLRDLHLVQHSDGRPYVRDGLAYVTATCAGMGFFQQAHWGVFTLDLARPERLTQVAQLYFRRDGLLLGDHAGQVVRDPEDRSWIVATSSWGDFGPQGVHVRHTTTTDDLLRGVHVLDTEPSPLPTEVSAWDPGLTRIGKRWHVSFVQSPSQDPFDFHPALAVGPAGASWHEGLELVGAASDLHQCEGPVLVEVEGQVWLLASDGDDRHYPVFTTAMRRVGRLDAAYPSNIPHPQLVPLDDGSHLLVTFDGTAFGEDVLGYGGHGDVIIMRSRPA